MLTTLGPGLDALHEATGTHVMARRTWLQVCLDHDERYTPLAVVIDGPDGGLDAAALLAVRWRGPLREVVALGHGRSDAAAFAARTPGAAALLGEAIVAVLRGMRGPWRFTVRHLPDGDPVAAQLAATLRRGHLVTDQVSPLLVLSPGRDLRSYVGKHYVKNRRRRVAKLAELGTPVEETVTRDPEVIAATLPEIVEVCRRRDHEMARSSIVDTPAGAGLFRDAVLAHARRGEMVLATARIDGTLAGYALCFVDGRGARPVLRVWNCRFDPAWAEYGIGQICRSALIEHAIAHGMSAVDWMLGNEPYKAALSNDSRASQDLFVASGALVAGITRLALAVRDRARDSTDDDATPPAWVRLARRVGRPVLGS